MILRPLIRAGTRPLLVALGTLALVPAAAGASEPTASQPTGSGTTSTEATTSSEASTTAPAVEAPVAPSPTTTATTESAPAPTPAPTVPSAVAPVEAAAPQVRVQHAQGSTPAGGSTVKHGEHAKTKGSTGGGQTETSGGSESSSSTVTRATHPAPAPSALTPPLPLTLGSPISGVSSFFIESFRIPPFLLPIYQAAGTAYGIPWQVLAAINEVETDYGRDLSVSSAGAEGWMQFLPAEWAQYGVDANGDGFKDPYNPADAIFTAARYLKAAGGDTDIHAAVYSYNHSQAYVDTVMLRAQLLGGTPSNLLGAITGLTEARFPVHAPSRFSDGFATTSASGTGPTHPTPKTLVGTTIYSQQGAPVIAVQDGEIVGSGVTPSLGRYVSLRDAYGNTYTYAELGSVATLYPVLEPHEHSAVSSRIPQAGASSEPAPSGPASAGAQPRSPLSEGAAVSGLALGAAAGLEAPAPAPAAPPVASPPPASSPTSTPRVFRAGSEDVYLHPLSVGVQVLAGTVLGHVGPGTSATGSTSGEGAEPHVLFQIRPAGVGAPLIDPKPILDGWVQLENTSIFRAKGENPFLGNSPTVWQVLLESKEQLEQQVLNDHGIHLATCGRQDVQTGQVDRRVLATLEFLSVSGLHPTVSSLRCTHVAPATAANAAETSAGDAVQIAAVNGVAIADGSDPTHLGSIAEIVIHKLSNLQGTMRPSAIVSLTSVPGVANTVAAPGQRNSIRVEFAPLQGGARSTGKARAAGAFSSAITPGQWIQLIARLGEIPDPKVGSGPSTASIPDHPGAAAAGAPTTGSTSTGSEAEGKETGGNR
jgi:hypothetical protein